MIRQKMFIAILLTAGVLLGFPDIAMAAEPGGDVNILEPKLANSLVTLIVFLSLLAVLYRFAWSPILQGLQAREENQYKALEDARLAREEASRMRDKLQAEFAQAQAQIRGMIEEARRDAEVLRTKEREAGVKDAQTERERARREIEMAKEQALTEIYQSAVELASNLSSKAIGRNLSAEDHRRLLSESMTELGIATRNA